MTDPILGSTADKAVLVALNGLAARQKAISNNVANVDTPGYKAIDVSFEDALNRAVAAGNQDHQVTMVADNPRHISLGATDVGAIQPVISQDNSTTVRVDGNNVDIDKEMVQLAETTASYNALVQLMSSRISLAKYIVNDGKGS